MVAISLIDIFGGDGKICNLRFKIANFALKKIAYTHPAHKHDFVPIVNLGLQFLTMGKQGFIFLGSSQDHLLKISPISITVKFGDR